VHLDPFGQTVPIEASVAELVNQAARTMAFVFGDLNNRTQIALLAHDAGLTS